MFSRLLTGALFAGAAVGLIAALLQLVFVQPVLLHAELYEGGELIHGTPGVSAVQDVGGFDALRDLLSVLFTMVIYCGYAMMLTVLMVLAEDRGLARITPRNGLLWGIAGFVAVQLAPAFSLAPEVPGVAAADVYARMVWWLATAVAAVVAMGLIAFGRGPAAWIGAVVLLVAPHLIGAPMPEAFEGAAPPELAGLFASRALGAGLAVWAMLGVACAWFWQRETEAAVQAQAA